MEGDRTCGRGDGGWGEGPWPGPAGGEMGGGMVGGGEDLGQSLWEGRWEGGWRVRGGAETNPCMKKCHQMSHWCGPPATFPLPAYSTLSGMARLAWPTSHLLPYLPTCTTFSAVASRFPPHEPPSALPTHLHHFLRGGQQVPPHLVPLQRP